MIKNVFDINHFNVFSDEENYYFFRALEDGDIKLIQNKTIVDEKGNLKKLVTDREVYGETIFKKSDALSLEQMVEHVKMNYNKHTNCISFSTNANVALDYGRNVFHDKYVMLKVPKDEAGKKLIFAGQYMLEQINQKLEDYYHSLKQNQKEDALVKYYFDFINNASNEEQLDKVRKMITRDYVNESDSIFVGGLDKITNSLNYGALNQEQNFLKNKIYLKMDIMNRHHPVLKKIGNRFLIHTIGNAFSSIEFIHYNDVEGGIKEVSPEIMDVLSLLQQLEETPLIKELKEEVIKKINEGVKMTTHFDLEQYDTNAFKKSLDLEKVYELTKGRMSYQKAITTYTKTYTLVKSKLRKEKSLSLLKEIINDRKYDAVIEKMREKTYGIESGLTNRISSKGNIRLSESVNLQIVESERYLLDYVNKMDISKLEDVLQNPFAELQSLIVSNYKEEQSFDAWFLNNLFGLIDWSYYNVQENLSESQKKLLLTNSFPKNSLGKIYHKLKEKKFDDKAIVNIFLMWIIRKMDKVDANNCVSLDELEEFFGCNKIKNTQIILKPYQREAIQNINEAYKYHDFTSVILPTGTGKSYVSLSEMHYMETEINKLDKNKHARMLYLAPNEYILNQLERIIALNYRSNYPFYYRDKEIVKSVFPNLTLCTYQYLNQGKGNSDIINNKYDFIVLDELHRAGASEWQKSIDKLLENQTAKVLGMTATPERDTDKRDMTEIFAKKYGYTEEEILAERHLSYNMDLLDAIERGIIHNPKVINCEYSLIKDGSLDELELKIDDIIDESKKKSKKSEYERIRKEINEADGIDKILNENLSLDGKYIVFIPVARKKNGVYTNTESGKELTETQAQSMIKAYQNLMNQLLFSGQYLKKHHKPLQNIYHKINQKEVLSKEELNYLNEEKENILLLVKLHINNMPNALQTFANDMALAIINYMNWTPLIDTKIASILKNKLKDEIETYCMLSDNSQKQNAKNLANFNSSKSSKKKFMFVIDMLNEGVHIEQIDGIIWFRPLNEDSKILFLQQLGRCISAICEDNKERIPLVIDLVNNTLKFNFLRDLEPEKDDLSRLKSIATWIRHFNKMPDIRVSDQKESNMAIFLRKIKRQYSKFIDDTKLEIQTVKRKQIIEQIIQVGSEFDLWNYEFPKEDNDYVQKKMDSSEDLFSKLSITGVLRSLYNLYRETDDLINANKAIILKEIAVYLQNQPNKITNYSAIDERLNSTGGKISVYLNNNRKKIIEQLNENENAKYICDYFGWLNEQISMDDILKEITEYLQNQTKPITNFRIIEERLKITGGRIGIYLSNNKAKIVEMAKENENAKYICHYFSWLEKKADVKDILEEITEYLQNQTKPITSPRTIDDRLKTTGGKIGYYLDHNKEKIIEQAKENENAAYVCDYFGWLDKKASMDDILKEITEYLQNQTKPITSPRTIDDRLKITGSKMSIYLVNNKEKIIEQANENENAKYICHYFGWLDKKITMDDILKEIMEYLQNQPSPISSPDIIEDKLKTTGGKISNYLKRNKEKISELALQENEEAKFIYNYFGWFDKKIIVTIDVALKEIVDYLRSHPNKITNYHNISDRIQMKGGKIGKYLDSHKKEIIELALQENEEAKFICHYFGWLDKKASMDDILKEITEYLRNQLQQITDFRRIEYKLKTTGSKMGNYLAYNKKEIIELALQENEEAKFICNYFKVFQKDLYKRLDELANDNSHFQNAKNILEESRDKKDGRTI